MDFMALVTMGTGGHYITMLPADWSTSTSHNLFALQFTVVKCCGIYMYLLASSACLP